MKVTKFPDAIRQEGSLQGDEENKKVHPDRSNRSRAIQDSNFDDLDLQGQRRSNLIGAFDSQPTLSQYLSIQTIRVSGSVWPLQAVEVPSESDDLDFDLEGHGISGRRLAGR